LVVDVVANNIVMRRVQGRERETERETDRGGGGGEGQTKGERERGKERRGREGGSQKNNTTQTKASQDQKRHKLTVQWSLQQHTT